MAGVKYIAAGFLNDAERLLNDFLKENTLSFPVFAEKWRKHNFSAIYMGRVESDLLQFTQEIFQITLGYLQKPTFQDQVAGIYLLYALYRNQLSEITVNEEDVGKNFVKIRLTIPVWNQIRDIQKKAIENKFTYLEYVIDYMNRNAFQFVYHETLFGPRSGKSKTEVDKPTVSSSFLLKDIKMELSKFEENNIFENLKASFGAYEEMKANVFKGRTQERENNICNEIDQFQKQLKSLVSDGAESQPMPGTSGIGSRRAAIKAAAFSQKASFRQLNPDDPNFLIYENLEYPNLEESTSEEKKKIPRRRCKRAKRKVGRQHAKNVKKEEKSINNSHSDNEQSFNRRRGPQKKFSSLDEYKGSISVEEERAIKLQEVKKCTTAISDDEDEFESEDIDIPDENSN